MGLTETKRERGREQEIKWRSINSPLLVKIIYILLCFPIIQPKSSAQASCTHFTCCGSTCAIYSSVLSAHKTIAIFNHQHFYSSYLRFFLTVYLQLRVRKLTYQFRQKEKEITSFNKQHQQKKTQIIIINILQAQKSLRKKQLLS